MMSDKDLERRLTELRDTWRVAGEAPLDRMWERVEAEAFASHRRPGLRWIRTLLPLAAMLVLGVRRRPGGAATSRNRSSPGPRLLRGRDRDADCFVAGSPVRRRGDRLPRAGHRAFW
jgi:hypothetical protein